MKDRERQCVYYIYETNCAKGHDGTFKKACQHCKFYIPKKGAVPRRKDLRKEKVEKWMDNKRNWE